MARHRSKIQVFDYLDYRVYLRDWYADRKANGRGFSLRAFSKEAGFNSPNFLKLVKDGDRNLTEKSIVPFIKGLQLTQQEEEFFRNLVFYTQADSEEEKKHFYEGMLRSRKFSQVKPLEKEQYQFFSTWYHPIVRELMTSEAFDGTPEYLVGRIRPAITVFQAAQSMELLQKLGLIRRTPEGRWEQSDVVLTTGAELRSRALMKYHRELLEIAKVRLEEVPADQRDLSALTLGIRPGQVSLFKEKIREFRRQILEMVSANTSASEVVILSIQLLPASGPASSSGSC